MNNVEIKGAEKLESALRLFVPIEGYTQKTASDTLIDNLSNTLKGFTVTQGKGVYKTLQSGQLLNENTLVIDILIDDKEPSVIKRVLNFFKAYGQTAHEETILFNMNGISYISEPDKLEVV